MSSPVYAYLFGGLGSEQRDDVDAVLLALEDDNTDAAMALVEKHIVSIYTQRVVGDPRELFNGDWQTYLPSEFPDVELIWAFDGVSTKNKGGKMLPDQAVYLLKYLGTDDNAASLMCEECTGNNCDANCGTGEFPGFEWKEV